MISCIDQDCPSCDVPPMKSTWRATASNVKDGNATHFGPGFAIDSKEYESNYQTSYFHSSTEWDVDVDQTWLQVGDILYGVPI